MEPFAEAGVYKSIVADLPMTRAALYSERTAAVHMTGALQTYESILWGLGVRLLSTSWEELSCMHAATRRERAMHLQCVLVAAVPMACMHRNSNCSCGRRFVFWL